MTDREQTDLGPGVAVQHRTDGTVVVSSPGLDFGWVTSAGRVPGSTVVWRNEPYEVVGRSVTSIHCQWTLRPWPENESIRSTTALNEDLVASMLAERERARRAHARRWWSVPLLPLLGFAPGVVQEEWRNEWGFPARWATVLSSLTELVVGNLLFMHILSLVAGGEPLLAWAPPLPLTVLLSSLFVCEGLVRIVTINADQLAVGSTLALPVLLFRSATPAAASPPSTVRVRRFGDDELEIETSHRRADWEDEPAGLLPYRDRLHELDHTGKTGSTWSYRFRPVEGQSGDDRPVLRLRPPTPSRPQPGIAVGGVGALLGNVILTVPMAFAPAEYQERWGMKLDFPPAGLTAIGAAAQLFGGGVNALARAGDGSPLLLLDLFLVVEGAVRLALVFVQKRPIASVLGLPLRPLYERWTKPR